MADNIAGITMFIITVLSVATNEINIVDCYNDELDAQDNYLNKIAELATAETGGNGAVYESVFISKTKCNIYLKAHGWLSSSKTLDKIVVLHSIPAYNIIDSADYDQSK